jgi:hypothetical protein
MTEHQRHNDKLVMAPQLSTIESNSVERSGSSVRVLVVL